jgi:hypothetical protein
MTDKTERWKELCALAAVEKDPKRLLELVQEITRLLDERDQKKEPPPDAKTQ